MPTRLTTSVWSAVESPFWRRRVIVRNSWSNGSLLSMSAEVPAPIQAFNRSRSSGRVDHANLEAHSAQLSDKRGSGGDVEGSDIDEHEIRPPFDPTFDLRFRGTTCIVANPHVSRALARAPANRSLPATRIRAGIPKGSGRFWTATLMSFARLWSFRGIAGGCSAWIAGAKQSRVGATTCEPLRPVVALCGGFATMLCP